MDKERINIMIPSKARCGLIKTIEWLPEDKCNISIFVEPQDYLCYKSTYGDRYSIVNVGADDKGVAFVRNFAVTYYGGGNVVHLDDDINKLLIRNDSRMRKAQKDEIRDLFTFLNNKLYEPEVGLVTISFSASNWLFAGEWKEPSRAWCFFGLNGKRLLEKDINFDLNLLFQEDYDLVAQILNKGLRSVCTYRYAFDCPKIGTTVGGCQTYRTKLLNEKNVEYLFKKWPGKIQIKKRLDGYIEPQFIWSKFSSKSKKDSLPLFREIKGKM